MFDSGDAWFDSGNGEFDLTGTLPSLLRTRLRPDRGKFPARFFLKSADSRFLGDPPPQGRFLQLCGGVQHFLVCWHDVLILMIHGFPMMICSELTETYSSIIRAVQLHTQRCHVFFTLGELVWTLSLGPDLLLAISMVCRPKRAYQVSLLLDSGMSTRPD
ncbi:hypothetical protein Acr_11g0009360 [Actinidia rufa]|uniref:Uncharacterized protein n=1 Tax=Actinidia rufa TaxID=165716 RepID=A0A7J0FD50_9ERIC|nr:hypothetical protein Acr_11g0009360 [Actinidia rufa]